MPSPPARPSASRRTATLASVPPPRSAKSAASPRPAAVATPIRIVVADEHTLDRKGLVAILHSQTDFRVVAECGTVGETIAAWGEDAADVIVLSLRLPDNEGSIAVPALRAACPNARILAVAERGEAHCMLLNPPRRDGLSLRQPDHRCDANEDCLQYAVTEGALGAIRRTADLDDLFRAVRTVASGTSWYEMGTAARLLERAAGLSRGSGSSTLSPRELDVLALISEGLANKEIAVALTVSEPTVKKHVGRILEKLELQDRLQIGLYIARNPLLLRQRTPH